jgi:hypothetical protein
MGNPLIIAIGAFPVHICSGICPVQVAARNNKLQEPRQRRGSRNHSCVNLGGRDQFRTSIDAERANSRSYLGNGSAGPRLAMAAKLLGPVEGNVGQS